MIKHRRRIKQTTTFKDRLVAWAEDVQKRADQLEPGLHRDGLLRKARQAETAAHLDDWANSPGLQPPR